MNQKPIRVGVVGVGYLGFHHARIYRELPGVSLVAVVDTNPRRLREVEERLGVAASTDLASLWGRVDAVSVAVPTPEHHPVTLACLRHGLDVLLEKPMTATLEEAEELVREASRRKAILQVGHLERFNAAVQALVPLVRDPRFIESHRLGPFLDRAAHIDVVLDLMIHDIDIILSLVRSPVVEVRATGVSVVSPHLDIANARLEFANGCVANVTASRVSQEKQRRIRIFQQNAYLSLDYQHQEILAYRRVQDAAQPRPRIEHRSIPVEKGEPLRAELEAFVHAVRTRQTPLVSGEEGMKALEVALRVLQEVEAHGYPVHPHG